MENKSPTTEQAELFEEYQRRLNDDLDWHKWPWPRKLAMGAALGAAIGMALLALGAVVWLLLVVCTMLAGGALGEDGVAMVTAIMNALGGVLAIILLLVVGLLLLSVALVGVWLGGE